eukprot:2804559-Pleurochrysis_carterae.AAC.1
MVAAEAEKKLAKKEKKGKKEEVAEAAEDLDKLTMEEGTHKLAVCTGVLASRKDSRDVKIESFSISLFGQQLFEDQTLELTYGHRYGLIAQNGARACAKRPERREQPWTAPRAADTWCSSYALRRRSRKLGLCPTYTMAT